MSSSLKFSPYLTAADLPRAAAIHNLTADDVARIKTLLQRHPTLTELAIFGALWSEHCSYKSTRALLRKLPSKGSNVVVGAGAKMQVRCCLKMTSALCSKLKAITTLLILTLSTVQLQV